MNSLGVSGYLMMMLNGDLVARYDGIRMEVRIYFPCVFLLVSCRCCMVDLLLLYSCCPTEAIINIKTPNIAFVWPDVVQVKRN